MTEENPRPRDVTTTSRLLGCLFLAIFAMIAVAVFLPFFEVDKWVGQTNLDVRFRVIDAETELPVRGASLHIRAERGGFCKERDEHQFTLVTDENGQANYLCESCMCMGSKGLFEDTFAVHLPKWWFHVTAPGYLATEPEYLDRIEPRRQARRGDGCAILDVDVPLRRDIGSKSSPSAGERVR